MAQGDAKSEVQGSISSADPNPNSVEATIESNVGGEAAESTCNNNNNTAESSAVTDGGEREKSLEYAEELMARGSKAGKEGDYGEATDCYSRALEIRVAHFGELAPECVDAYYKYGCTLLYKAQEEADPFGSIPKKEVASQEDTNTIGSVKAASNGESSSFSVLNNAEQDGSADCSNDAPENILDGKDEEAEGESEDEELADGDEDESDLDLAWKMLDVARAIVEKLPGDTMEKVDILSSLAEVALEREDVETSLSDYSKALSILERLVEPDSRLIAELNFRICLCLEIGSKPQEAIPYCEKAISVCKARVQRLTNEVKNLSEIQTASESGQAVQLFSSTSVSSDSLVDNKAEIETLTGLCGELEKKHEDLHQLVSNPKSILSDILGMMSAKAEATEKGVPVPMSSLQKGNAGTVGSASSAAASTAHTNGASGVTDLGVVGRGVKRVVMSPNEQPGPVKKPCFDPSSNNGDGSAF